MARPTIRQGASARDRRHAIWISRPTGSSRTPRLRSVKPKPFERALSMSHESTYQPKMAITRWLDTRLPIIRFTADFMVFPTPRNINYLWAFGAILFYFLVVQLYSGIILAMH